MSTSARVIGSDRAPAARETLLEVRRLRVEGQSDDRWSEIVKGINLTLRRGEVLDLIGESGASKSTIGLADDGARRHNADRGAGGDQGHRPPVLYRRDLH